MSIKIFGKKFFRTPLEMEREKLKDLDAEIADEYNEYESEFGEDRYTEKLQEKQKEVRKRLDEIGWK